MYIYLHEGAQSCTFKCQLQHKSTQCANNCTRQHKSVHCTYNCTLQHKCKHTTANSSLQCKDCTMRYNCMFKYKLLNKGAHCSTEMHSELTDAHYKKMCKYNCTLQHKGVLTITCYSRGYVHCTSNCKLRHKGVQKTYK